MKSSLVSLFALVLAMYTVTSAENAKITVTAPNGGGVLASGASTNITWTSTGDVDSVEIHLTTDNGNKWELVATDVPNSGPTGTYAWTVPDVSSEECRIRVSDVKQGGPYDMSDSTFRIIQIQKITVTSPNGGDSLKVGTRQQITWSTYGLIDSVKVELSKDNGDSWMVFTAKTLNTGIFKFYVPDLVTEQCIVKVSSAANESVSDVSDAPFSIYNPNVVITNQIDLSVTGTLAAIGVNPVTNTVAVTLHLAQREEVSLEIYSIQGKLVAEVTNEMKKAGLHTVQWNSTDRSGQQVPNGTYCVRLQIGSKVFAGMVAVIR
jgi:hypothetical protein